MNSLAIFIGIAVFSQRVLKQVHRARKLGAWLGCFLLLGLNISVFQGPYKLVPAVSNKSPEVTAPITIEQGSLTGVKTADHKVEVYAGIPYAQAPVGDLRWKEPQDPLPWQGILAADHFQPMSMQPQEPEIIQSLTRIIGFHDYQISLDDNYRHVASEDSLYVNVWKPAGDVAKMPVLVYIHGGSLQTG